MNASNDWDERKVFSLIAMMNEAKKEKYLKILDEGWKYQLC